MDAYIISQIAEGKIPLDGTLQIEDALLAIHAAEKKIEHYSALKKKRVSAIEKEVNKQQTIADNLRSAVKSCLEASGEKTLDFPGIGKCTVINKKGSWIVTDTSEMEKDLKNRGLLDSVSETTVKIIKKDLNKLLDKLEKNRNIPSGVVKEDDKKTLSVSFADDVDSSSLDIDNFTQVSLPSEQKNVTHSSQLVDPTSKIIIANINTDSMMVI